MMSLIYYILLRCATNDIKFSIHKPLFFIYLQMMFFVIMPIQILTDLQKKNVINWFSYDSFFGDYKFIPLIITIIFLIIYDYFNYFKSEKEKEILTKYTYKYDLIDNHPIMFFLLFFCFLPLLLIAFLVIFLKFFI